jgi:transcriptional regulator with XRE-family HTH domain
MKTIYQEDAEMLAEQIRVLLIRQKKTQIDLSVMAGVSKQTVNNNLRLRGKNPLNNLEKYLYLLNN